MPKPTTKPMRAHLLHLAQSLPCFLSQDNQTYVACPTAIPVFSEDFFTWLLIRAQKRLGHYTSPSEIGRIAGILDTQARAAKATEAVHTRIAKIGTKSYQLDLGTDDHQVINITGQHWRHTHHFAAQFERLEDHEILTTPEPTAHTLATWLEKMFQISTENADKLALWLAEALLPDQKTPPVLVITGKAREAAVLTLRNLIDPVHEPIIETPVNCRQLPRMALENKTLTFSVNDQIPEKTIRAINEIHQGKRLRIKHCTGKRLKLHSIIQRPVIIATEEPLQISPKQFNLEINEAVNFHLGKIIGSLLNFLVKIIGQPVQQPTFMTMPQQPKLKAFAATPTFDSS